MKLPDKFQFRVAGYTGYTHVAKRLDNNEFKIYWARGWGEDVQRIEWFVCEEGEISKFVTTGNWIIADEKKAQEQSLPDEFYIISNGTKYIMIKSGAGWRCWYPDQIGHGWHGAMYDKEQIEYFVEAGYWKIINKKPLTVEQKRFNKEYREQIAQLESSIRIHEQSIEHYNRLIGNYCERIETLKSKIVEGDE